MRLAKPLCILSVMLPAMLLPGADWPRFRGADGSGVSADTGLPVSWSEKENVVWKVELPGPGSSSPIIVGDRIFLTAYSGYGKNQREPGDQKDLRRHVLCIQVKDGKILWDRPIESSLPEVAYRGIGVPNHGYASSTPVADGEQVYAFFGKTGVIAHDHSGKETWRSAVAPDPKTHDFGSASSLILWKDLVIVTAGIECEALVAFDKKSGKEVWRSSMEGYGVSWATPLLNGEGENQEILVSVPGELWAINPRNGKLRWHSETFPDRNMCPSPVVANGIAYVIGGRQGGSAAVRLGGGRGDVTGTHRVWTQGSGSYVTSPVVLGSLMFWVTDRGIANCVKVETGEKVYSQRVEGAGGIYASPVAADDKLYVVTRRNGTFVIAASAEYRQLGHNQLAGDDSDFNASPAISAGRLYLRSDRFLYCLGKPAARP